MKLSNIRYSVTARVLFSQVPFVIVSVLMGLMLAMENNWFQWLLAIIVWGTSLSCIYPMVQWHRDMIPIHKAKHERMANGTATQADYHVPGLLDDFKDDIAGRVVKKLKKEIT